MNHRPPYNSMPSLPITMEQVTCYDWDSYKGITTSM